MTVDIDNEKQSIQRDLEKYVRSINESDTTLASEVWWQSCDASMVSPFGRFQGWEEVRDGFYVGQMRQRFSERTLRPSNVSLHVSGNIAWAVFDWTFAAKLVDGQPYESQGWETQVYRKSDHGWVIVHVHYSVPPRSS